VVSEPSRGEIKAGPRYAAPEVGTAVLIRFVAAPLGLAGTVMVAPEPV
jgi:hypothetical protein